MKFPVSWKGLPTQVALLKTGDLSARLLRLSLQGSQDVKTHRLTVISLLILFLINPNKHFSLDSSATQHKMRFSLGFKVIAFSVFQALL